MVLRVPMWHVIDFKTVRNNSCAVLNFVMAQQRVRPSRLPTSPPRLVGACRADRRALRGTGRPGPAARSAGTLGADYEVVALAAACR